VSGDTHFARKNQLFFSNFSPIFFLKTGFNRQKIK
jgi:hypothetical protein